jgi:hypothetical protein
VRQRLRGSCSALLNDMVFMPALVGVSVKELLCRSVMPNDTATHTLVDGCVRQRGRVVVATWCCDIRCS